MGDRMEQGGGNMGVRRNRGQGIGVWGCNGDHRV